MSRYSNRVIVCTTFLSFVLIAGLLYYNAIHNPFHYDDAHHITMNPGIRDLSGLSSLFSDPSTFSSEGMKRGSPYRPLLMLTYALNFRVNGLNPAGYHIVNLAFHAGSAFLLFLIVRAIFTTPAYFAALSAGIIFLVHPFNSEIVNYISTRSSVMSGFFYLSAFYCWVRFRRDLNPFFYIASLLSFAAGMLSKESAVTLPLVLWIYDVYFLRGQRTPAQRLLKDWRKYIPYLPFILIVVIPYLYVWGVAFSGAPHSFKRDPATQLFTELPALVKYLQMFIVPVPLTLVHDMEVYRTVTIPVIFSAVVLSVYTAVALFLFRSSSASWRAVSFFMLWFFIVLLPTTVIPLNLILQEHRGYLAIITMAVFAGVILDKLRSSVSRAAALFLLIALCTAYSAVTITRNTEWRDDLTLWTDTVKKAPGSSIAHAGLGIAYKDMKMYDQAIESLRTSISIHDGQESLTARHNLAQIYFTQGKLDLAATELEDLLKSNPDNLQIYNDLGIIYYEQNRPGLAEEVFLRATQRHSNNYLPFFNLGVLYTKEGRLEEAICAFQNAAALDPSHAETRVRLQALLDSAGEKKK